MEDVFDYLKWRGDLSFLEHPLNEVDSLIFCAFAYFKIEDIIVYNEYISIQDLYLRYKKVEEDTLFKKNQNLLFKALSESNRFQDIVVTKYFNEVDKSKEMQIAGMTFILPNHTLYVAFKGTDESLTGWKEDFNLSYMNVIPAEKKACSYLNEVLQSTRKKVYVGGHSKGGTLAMYAALFCENDDNIIQVYNNDGPGFSKDILETEMYDQRKEKIITFIPKASIVGNIFNKDTKTFIIKSKQIGILQHDLFSWQVLNSHFVYTNEISNDAKKISHLLNQAIEQIPEEQKERVITFVYDLLDSWNVADIQKMFYDAFFSKKIFYLYNLNIENFSLLGNILSLVIEFLRKV